MSSPSIDLAVVGAGVFGSWLALAARRAGFSVILLDKHGPAHPHSSSGGESRIIRLAYGGDELYTRFAARSLGLWKEFLLAEGAESCFRRTGVLWLADAHARSVAAAEDTFQKLGTRYEHLDDLEIARRYPQMEVKNHTAAVFEPESGAILAEPAVKAVHAAAIREGMQYRSESVCRPPVASGGCLDKICTTAGESISASLFVFACGAWLPKLFPVLLSELIHPTRQELFFFDPPLDSTSFDPSALPIWIDETETKIAYGFPNIDGAGVKAAFHQLGPAFDPDSMDRAASAEGGEAARAYLRNRLPALADARLKSARVCPYENTSSGDFLIDRHPELDNVWIVGGGSGHGFKHGPAVAEYTLGVVQNRLVPENRFLLASKERVLNRKVL